MCQPICDLPIHPLPLVVLFTAIVIGNYFLHVQVKALLSVFVELKIVPTKLQTRQQHRQRQVLLVKAVLCKIKNIYSHDVACILNVASMVCVA